MRKIFLTAIALLSIASASVFGMYGVDTDWIDFLTHGNQFRARLDQLGFVLGNDTIKGTFGFDNNTGYGGIYGALLNANTTTTLPNGDNTAGNHYYDWVPTISMGIGYTSSAISVGVGYNATLGPRERKADGGERNTESKTVQTAAHTPVLVLNALDNAFRMAIPIQVYVDKDKYTDGSETLTAVSFDSQFRYYTGLEMLPQVRLYLRYGNATQKSEENGTTTKIVAYESFGFQFRLYFGSVVEEVAVNPFIRLDFNSALGYTGVTRVEAVKVMKSLYSSAAENGSYRATPKWDLTLMPALGLTANSDIVSLYLEPSLGLKVTQNGSDTIKKNKEVYGLGYNVYAEIYITPIKNLQWYFEAEIGNVAGGSTSAVTLVKGLGFNGTTGVTWYLPAL